MRKLNLVGQVISQSAPARQRWRCPKARFGVRPLERLIVIVMFTLSTFTHGSAVLAAEDSLESLAGPLFTDPNKTFPMSEEWQQRPIQHQTKQSVDLAIVLDQQQYPALMPLIQAFRIRHNLRFAFGEGTCGTSAGALSKKNADIGGFCCAAGKADRLPGLRFHTVGIGPVALIAHPDNPVNGVSMKEARGIFSGKIYKWSELSNAPNGSSELIVRPVIRLHCKLRPGHWRRLLDNEQQFDPMAFDAASIDDMILHVARNRAAIGFAYLWQIDRRHEDIKVKVLRLDGYDPRDLDATKMGNYPLYRVFNLTTWQDPPAANPWAEKLVSHVLENSGQIDPNYAIVPSTELRSVGWKFVGNELVGEPTKRHSPLSTSGRR